MTSRAALPRADDAWIPRVAFVLVVLALALELVCAGSVPFVSEDWTQMAEMRAVPTFLGALDPRLEPLRPLQHAFFWILAHGGGDPAGRALPLGAHAIALLLQAGSCVCVYLLAREAGTSRASAFAAVVLFAVFPNVKTLAWSAAIGSAGRVCFELLALLLFARHAREPSGRRGALALLAFAVALAFHESAMLLPAIVALWIVYVQGATFRDGLSRLRMAARDPRIRALACAAVLYAVQLALRPQRHHELKSLASMPAGIVKAATALFPEAARTSIIDGFRTRDTNAMGFVLACALFLALAVTAIVLLRRSRTARFVLLACAVDLGLAVVGAGFVQRYAYFSSALLAVGLGVWFGRRPGVLRAVPIVLIAGWWVADTAIDLRDMRDMDRMRGQLVAGVREQRKKAGDGVPIAILDPDDMTGPERDIPLFNWGLDYLLEAHGVSGPILLWRTRPYATSTNVELVDPVRVETARRTGSPPIVERVRLTER